MKIEKLNDNQIRCTLNKGDLASRELKISELAYGTEKAKNLFRDMLKQAAYEFGFEADDFPLMIEAIPMSAESIVLIITKVDDPEELDTRFSKFTPSYEDMEDMEDLDEIDVFPRSNEADDFLDIFSVPDESSGDTGHLYSNDDTMMAESLIAENAQKQDEQANLTRFYSFPDLKTIEKLAHVLNNVYYGRNSLYKDEKNQTYHLVLTKSDHTPQEFNKILNITSEYGTKENTSPEKENFFREHYQPLITNSALQILADVL